MYKEAVEAGVTIFENRKLLQTILKKIVSYAKHGNIHIGVIGPGGVGKTTLGRFLSGAQDETRENPAYRESMAAEKYDLKGDYVSTITVMPGQKDRRDDWWPSLFRSLAAGKSRGIINVVAYGYHAMDQISFHHVSSVYQPGMSSQEFMEHYVAKKRAEELELINSIEAQVKLAKVPVWMVTLITKQDLWWNQRQKVKEHYAAGDYDKVIKRIESALGSQNFCHEYLSASLVINNFRSGTGELLVANEAGYDQSLQLTNLNYLFTSIEALATRRSQ